MTSNYYIWSESLCRLFMKHSLWRIKVITYSIKDIIFFSLGPCLLWFITFFGVKVGSENFILSMDNKHIMVILDHTLLFIPVRVTRLWKCFFHNHNSYNKNIILQSSNLTCKTLLYIELPYEGRRCERLRWNSKVLLPPRNRLVQGS